MPPGAVANFLPRFSSYPKPVNLRTQLVIASFLLSIMPLSAIVGYSYHSSREAVEAAYRREAATLTRQMETRLASLRTDLERRLAEVSALPLHASVADVTLTSTDVPLPISVSPPAASDTPMRAERVRAWNAGDVHGPAAGAPEEMYLWQRPHRRQLRDKRDRATYPPLRRPAQLSITPI